MGDQIGTTKTLFSDTFDGPLSTAKWDYNHWQANNNPSFYGRTQQRQGLPDAKNGVVRLELDTYNPSDSKHQTFLGSEIITKQKFGLNNDKGVAFEVKAKFVNVPKGVVGGIFTYAGDAKKHDEIDWEALSNDLYAGKSQIQTNIYADEPLGAGHVKFVPIASPLTDYHTYRIEWLPNQVRWLVDGKVVRVEKEHVPKKAMALHLNVWAPSEGWANAYDASLKPAGSQGQNKSAYFDATYAKVFELSTKLGGAGDNALKGSGVSDWIQGRSGDDVIRGRKGGDSLFGGRGDDDLAGGRGNDRLEGGKGNDLLKGGAGKDTFVFDTRLGPDNVDKIKDFTPGTDKIELSTLVFAAAGQAGALAPEAFHVGTGAHDADDRIIYDEATGGLLYDADGAGGAAAVLFATLKPGLALSAGDFVLA